MAKILVGLEFVRHIKLKSPCIWWKNSLDIQLESVALLCESEGDLKSTD